MNKELVTIILKSGKDQSPKRYHPWIFSGAIKKIKGSPAEGDLVRVVNNKDEFLGIGHYQPGSIAVRIISFEDSIPGEEFWKSRIQDAYNLRASLGFTSSSETNAYRLVHAEGDLLPGLIMDYYNGVVVMQAHSVGMYLMKEIFVEALKEIYGEQLIAVYDKSSNTLPHKSDIEKEDGFLFGTAKPQIVKEYGNSFYIDWEKGQKTGFFIDQRENRKLLGEFSNDKKVLNMFGYTGGFSIYALQGGAKEVVTVDSSQIAIDQTNQNVLLNYPKKTNHSAFAVDAFKYMDDMKSDFDVIILDPPAFAKHHNVLPNALQGYKRLNAKAIEKIKKYGFLFTYSCSQVVSKENFKKSVFAAAASTGRNVRILYQLTQPADHPVNIYHPESEYLKGLVVQVF